MARIAAQIGALILILSSVLTASVLLVAALVAWLEPMTGLAAALAIAAAGFLFVALLLGLVLGAMVRAEKRRRRGMDAIIGLAELALALIPRRHLQRLEAGVAAGVGLAALVAILLRPVEDKDE